MRLIGITFFALAAYLTAESIQTWSATPGPGSPAGLAVTAAALVVMPPLALAKRRTGQALGNRTLIADSAETAFCAFTSAAALAGVGLNTGSAGGGPTRPPRSSSPPWPSGKASKPGTRRRLTDRDSSGS